MHDHLKSRMFTLFEDIIFKASFKSLSGINEETERKAAVGF